MKKLTVLQQYILLCVLLLFTVILYEVLGIQNVAFKSISLFTIVTLIILNSFKKDGE